MASTLFPKDGNCLKYVGIFIDIRDLEAAIKWDWSGPGNALEHLISDPAWNDGDSWVLVCLSEISAWGDGYNQTIKACQACLTFYRNLIWVSGKQPFLLSLLNYYLLTHSQKELKLYPRIDCPVEKMACGVISRTLRQRTHLNEWKENHIFMSSGEIEFLLLPLTPYLINRYL